MAEEQEKNSSENVAPAEQTVLSFDALCELKRCEWGDADKEWDCLDAADDDDTLNIGYVFDDEGELVSSPLSREVEEVQEVEAEKPEPPYGPFDDATAIALFNSRQYEELRKCSLFILGSWAAAYYKGVCLEKGLGGVKIPNKIHQFVAAVIDEIRLAATRGDGDAQNALGSIYEAGYSVDPDCNAAFSWYFKGMESGSPKALYNVARCYDYGIGVPPTYRGAYKIYREAAKRGHAKAQYTVAMMALTGHGVDKNSDIVAYWLQKAAASGHEEAVQIMAACGGDVSTARVVVEAILCQTSQRRSRRPLEVCDYDFTIQGGSGDSNATPPPSRFMGPHGDFWILKSAPEGSEMPSAATRDAVKTPDLLRANPSFAALLIKYVRDRFGGDAPFVYRSAGISRKTYSAIIGNELRPVSKRTAIAFAFALRLPGAEFRALLKSAGFALSAALLEDLIFKACLDAGIYNLRKISEILEAHGAKPFELQDEEENEVAK